MSNLNLYEHCIEFKNELGLTMYVGQVIHLHHVFVSKSLRVYPTLHEKTVEYEVSSFF